MLEKTHGNLLGHKSVVLGQKQTAVKFRMFCKEDNVQSVLASELSPILSSIRTHEGEIEFVGKVTAKLLVDEQNGAVGGMSYTADISDVFSSPLIFDDSIVTATLTVLDSAMEVDGAEVTVNAVVGAEFTLFEPIQKEYLEQSNLQCRTQEVRLGQVVANVDEVFSVVDEMEIKDDIARVLSTQSNVIINSAVSGDGVLTVSGEVVLNLVYIPTNQDLPKSVLLPFEFTQEVPSSGNGVALLDAIVKATKIHLEVLEEQKTSVFSVDVVTALKGVVVADNTQSLVVDCFSTTNALTTQNASIDTTLAKGVFLKTATIEGNVEFESAEKQDYYGVFGWTVTVLSATAKEDGVEVSGIISGDLLFGKDKLNSMRVEIPFQNTVTEIGASVGDTVEVFGVVRQAQAEFLDGAIGIDAQIALSIKLSETVSATFVSDVTEGGSLEDNFGAIEVSLAFKGDRLWDIAKSLNMSVEDILKLNPQLTDPLEQDEKLLVYHRRTA